MLFTACSSINHISHSINVLVCMFVVVLDTSVWNCTSAANVFLLVAWPQNLVTSGSCSFDRMVCVSAEKLQMRRASWAVFEEPTSFFLDASVYWNKLVCSLDEESKRLNFARLQVLIACYFFFDFVAGYEWMFLWIWMECRLNCTKDATVSFSFRTCYSLCFTVWLNKLSFRTC